MPQLQCAGVWSAGYLSVEREEEPEEVVIWVQGWRRGKQSFAWLIFLFLSLSPWTAREYLGKTESLF